MEHQQFLSIQDVAHLLDMPVSLFADWHRTETEDGIGKSSFRNHSRRRQQHGTKQSNTHLESKQ